MTKKLKFQTGFECVDQKLYEYNTSCTIRDMIDDFISKANAELEKDNSETRIDLNN